MFEILKSNFCILMIFTFILVLLKYLIIPIYNRIIFILPFTRVGEFFSEMPNFKKIISVLLYIIFIAILTGLQQVYSIFHLVDKDNRLSLVISILTLYGILYAFLQFTINFALQNVNDKYWGRSLIQGPVARYLKLNLFKSGLLKISLIYSLVFPLINSYLFKTTVIQSNYKEFLESLWEVSIILVCLIYLYVFVKTLSGMRILFNINIFHYEMAEEIIDYYKKLYNYSYKYRKNHFLNTLINDVKKLAEGEQTEMVTSILLSVIDFRRIKIELNAKKNIEKSSKILKLISSKLEISSTYFHNLFKDIFSELSKNNIVLKLEDLLLIYTKQQQIIYEISISDAKQNTNELLNNFKKVYSYRKGFYEDKGCTYFELPNCIVSSISSYEDIEEVHKCIKNTEGYKLLFETSNYISSTKKIDKKWLLEGYKNYVNNLLNYYKKYANEINKNNYSYFWDIFDLNKSSSVSSEKDEINYVSDVIYNYIIRLEYNNENKKYSEILLKKLNFKYKATFIFYHMLYTGPSWEWKKEIIYFKNIITNSWNDNSSLNSDVIEFICQKIEESNIGHRIDATLIYWIFEKLKIRVLNSKILEESYNLRYISYTLLIKFMFIFSERDRSLFNFYDDLENSIIEYGNWKIDFIHGLLQNPNLLKESFFVQHVLQLFKEEKYSNEFYFLETDFRVFYLNNSFNISEMEFANLITNHPSKAIIKFLILQIYKQSYSFLLEGESANLFLIEVSKIIDQENKTVSEYIENLISEANDVGSKIYGLISVRIQIVITNKLEAHLYD